MQNIKIHQNFLWKIICVVTLVIYIIGVLSAWANPAKGTEVNIYLATPGIFWVSLGLLYIIGIVMILFSETNHVINIKSVYQKIGYLFLFLGSITLLELCNIRGYYTSFLTYDFGTHIGYINEILSTQHFASNPYPLTHIFFALQKIITDNDLVTVVNHGRIVVFAIFLLGLILVGKYIFNSKGIQKFIIIFVSILPMGSCLIVSLSGLTELIPNAFGYLLFPLLVYCLFALFTHSSYEYLIISSLLIIIVTLIHPMLFFVVMGLLLSLGLVACFENRKNSKYNRVEYSKKIKIIILLSIISIAIFMIWHFIFRTGAIAGIFSTFFMGLESNGYNMKTVNLLSSSQHYGYGIETYLRMAFINIIIYISIPLVGIIYLIQKIHVNKQHILLFSKRNLMNNRCLFPPRVTHHSNGINNEYFLTLYVLSAFAILLTIIIAFSGAGVSIDRFQIIFFICGIMCSGYLFYLLFHLFKSNKKGILVKIVTYVVICLICFISIFSFYPSPITLSANPQDTKSEIQTAETFLPILNLNYHNYGICYTALGRYADAIYGLNIIQTTLDGKKLNRQLSIKSYIDTTPYHFNYENVTNFGKSILSDSYVYLENEMDYYKAYYPEMIPYRYTDNDLLHFEFDNTVNKIYNIGDIRVSLVKSESSVYGV